MENNKTLKHRWNFTLKWEHILIVIFIIVNIINSNISPHYLNIANLLKTTQIFVEKGIIGLVLLLLIVSGNIDISFASTIALSTSVFALCFKSGVNIFICIVLALITGAICGFLNGFIITRTGLPSIIVTLVNLSLFRGLAFVLMKDEGVYGFPEKFIFIGNGKIPGTPIPIELVIFIVLAVVCGIFLHKSYWGRYLYAIGANADTAFLSGINVKKVRLILFTISGFVYAFAGILLVSRIGSVRPNIATGFELEVVAMIVFGGAAIFGGSGTLGGFIISLFIIGFVRFGLGLINIPGQVMLMVTGSLLIVSILANNFIGKITERRALSKGSNVL